MSTRHHSLDSKSALAALLLVGALVFVGSTPGALAQATSVTLEFGGRALDLDSGTLYPEGDQGASKDSGGRLFYKYTEADIRLTYNPHRGVPTVVLHNQISGVEIAVLQNTPFAEITDDDLLWVTFSATLVDQPFGPDDTIVVKTDNGAHFKLGHPVVDGSGDPPTLTFGYERLDTLQSRESCPSAEPATAVASVSPGLSTSDWKQIRGLLTRAAYGFDSRDGTVIGSNPAHQLRIAFDANGVSVKSAAQRDAAWEWSLVAQGLGYRGQVRSLERVQPVADRERVEYRRAGLVEWFVNDERGLEQGFTLARPPQEEGAGALIVRLASRGNLSSRVNAEGSEITLADASGNLVLRYGGLVAWDAEGRDLPARMVAEETGLRLEIDDRSAVYPIVIDPVFGRVTELSAFDGEPEDFFGGSVAISGETVVVGTDIACEKSGSAYVFVREGFSWVLQEKLTAGVLGNAWNCFGISVAISGDTIVVGARDGDGASEGSGAAYVFERSGTDWGEPTRLFAADDGSLNDAFGVSVGVSGQTIVVGAYGDDDLGPGAGSAYVFASDGNGWVEQHPKLTASDGAGGDSFGFAVSISGDTIVVGADGADAADPGDPAATVSGSGKAYVFRYDGSTWAEEQFLSASDPGIEDRFGSSVSVSGQTVLVGSALHESGGLLDAGAAYVFVRGDTGWTEQQKLIAGDSYFFALFGTSVAVYGELAVVGAPDPFFSDGAAYLYVRDGGAWAAETKLEATGFDNVENLGVAVAVADSIVVAGADESDRAEESDFGAAYIFQEGPPNVPPVALCEDVMAEADAVCVSEASIDSGSYDPDGDDLTLTQEPPGPYALGMTGVILTVVDPLGESDSCDATVTVYDAGAPELTVDTTPIIVTDLDCSASELIELPVASASDNCTGSPAVSNGYDASPVEFFVGHTAVTYTATDEAGNVATAVLPVTVLPFDGDGDGSFCYDDCNDADPLVYPGADELCDLRDNDCDGEIDEGLPNGDGDIYPDDCDNCPATPNDGQENWNGDELGDACQDFDQDGLLDETEIQTANSEGCPFPDNPDSDFDTLLDGEETDAGTDPCSADTDGDGVDDADDPTPTVPGVPGSWLEQELRDEAAHVRGLDLQLFEGRTEIGQQARRTQLAARFDKASNGVRKANVVTATEMLERARMRIDGEPSPGEFMVPSPEKTDLLEQTDLYLSLLEQM